MTREELIEAMARAIFDVQQGSGPTGGMDTSKMWDERNYTRRYPYIFAATRALSAIEAVACVVPKELTPEIADALVDSASIYDEWGIDKFVENPAEVYASILNASPFKGA